MNNNILLNIYNITDFNKFIDILNNLQCESNEIIIELFKEYLSQYNIIVFNDTIISNLQRILNYLFTYNFIELFKRYNLYIDKIIYIINNDINDNEKQILNKIIYNNFRNEDLSFFINYNFIYNDNNYSIYIKYLQNFFNILSNIFSYEQINFIIENLNKIKNIYQDDIILLYNKLLIHFNIYYKNINTKDYFDNLINILSTNNIIHFKFFLLYDIINYIEHNIN